LQKWDDLSKDQDPSPLGRATAFSKALKDKELDLGKGDFAHVVSELIVQLPDAQTFDVPGYLSRAITAATI
jgi:hypothetical protein